MSASWTQWAEALRRLGRNKATMAQNHGQQSEQQCELWRTIAYEDALYANTAHIQWRIKAAADKASEANRANEQAQPEPTQQKLPTQPQKEDLDKSLATAIQKVNDQIAVAVGVDDIKDNELESVKKACNELVDTVKHIKENASPTMEHPVKKRRKGKTHDEDTVLDYSTTVTPIAAPKMDMDSKRPTKHRRRGKGKQHKKQEYELFFANSNVYTRKAERFVLREHQHDAWMIVETHQRGNKMQEAIARASKEGWSISSAPARRSTTSVYGTYGGVYAAFNSRHQTSPFTGNETDGKHDASKVTDLAGRTLIWPQGNIMVFASYAKDGEYAAHLAEVMKRTQGGETPFLWFADWNTPAEELEKAAWLHDLRAKVHRPTGGDISCHQGKG